MSKSVLWEMSRCIALGSLWLLIFLQLDLESSTERKKEKVETGVGALNYFQVIKLYEYFDH